MVLLLHESNDRPRPFAGALSRQIDGSSGAKRRAQRIAIGDARSRRRSIERPIRPIPTYPHHNVVRGVNNFRRIESDRSPARREYSIACGDVAREQWSFVRFEHVQRRSWPRVDLQKPDRIILGQKINAVKADKIQFRSDSGDAADDLRRLRWVNVDGSRSAAISKRRSWRWRGPLRAEADDFDLFAGREEQSRDAVSADAPLKIRIRPSASRGFRDSDMIATSPASLFHEPESGLIRRRQRDLRMSNAVCIANLREDKRILCALQRFGVVAEDFVFGGLWPRWLLADVRNLRHRRAQSVHGR